MVSRPASRSLGLAAFVGAAAFGLFAGCELSIDEGLSCGDGYVSVAEECDPADPDQTFRDACRERGFQTDAVCDRDTCRILDSDSDCNVCGDGLARGNEECDGADLKGQSCALGNLSCTSSCEYDTSQCPSVCGDGVKGDDEECDYALDCDLDEDCEPGEVCYQPLGECVSAGMGGFVPVVACIDYTTAYSDVTSKPYASGTIGDCTQECIYSRDDCSFCGDGELDGSYNDITLPSGKKQHGPEICDGEQARIEALNMHCRPLCLEPPYDPEIDVRCDFDCMGDCQGIELPGDITPGDITPADLNCCLGPGSACVGDGVPDLPCCATPNETKPDGCAWSATPPISLVCPGLPGE